MTQATLDFSADISRGRHNPNSQEAHAKLDKGNLRNAILDFIKGHPGLTTEAISERTGIKYQTVSGRISELSIGNFIKAAGVGKTSGGFTASTWEAK